MIDLKRRYVWWIIFLASLGPLATAFWRAFTGDLGADPGKELVEFLGITALVFLLITLSLTPLKMITKSAQVIRFRRMLGLYCFFYALLHVTGYLLFLANWADFLEDILKRPYITLGFLAFVVLTILAFTSPKAMVRRLARNWKKLHRLIYIAAVLVIIHFLWQAKADITEPVVYGLVTAVLLLFRLPVVQRVLR